jgi:23S rRNA pseudouridine2457 synthase
MKKYYIINKPYNVLCQFTDKEGRETLADYFKGEKDVYSAGRLDRDSEGLLILTNDNSLNSLLLNPVNKHEREYYVQVEGVPQKDELDRLQKGVVIEGKITLPAKAKLIDDPGFPPRSVPNRERKNIPTSWISLTLVEGRNRQVRKMTAAVGHPTLRLIRVRIKNIKLEGLAAGAVRPLTPSEVSLLKKQG